MSLCPEAEMRAAMSEADFWAHVLLPGQGPMENYDPAEDLNHHDLAEMELEARLADPCPACGQVGACAYDGEGRALIHVTEDGDR